MKSSEKHILPLQIASTFGIDLRTLSSFVLETIQRCITHFFYHWCSISCLICSLAVEMFQDLQKLKGAIITQLSIQKTKVQFQTHELYFRLFLFFSGNMCVCACLPPWSTWESQNSCSPFVLWVPGVELMSSDLAASALTCWASLLIPSLSFPSTTLFKQHFRFPWFTFILLLFLKQCILKVLNWPHSWSPSIFKLKHAGQLPWIRPQFVLGWLRSEFVISQAYPESQWKLHDFNQSSQERRYFLGQTK